MFNYVNHYYEKQVSEKYKAPKSTFIWKLNDIRQPDSVSCHFVNSNVI